jgi:hypothetical protein
MNTSLNKYDAIEHMIFEEGLKITSVNFNELGDTMYVHVNNQLTLVVAVKMYKNLEMATIEQLNDFSLIGNGTGIHWFALDEDLSLKGFLQQYLRQKIYSEKELVLA